MTSSPGGADAGPSPDRSNRPNRNHARFGLACLASLILLIAAYSNHFENAFHFDDSHVIESNFAIRSLHDVSRFFVDPHTFSSRPENALYRPLLTLSYALDYRAGDGLDPAPFHRTQFALLIVLGILLFALYKRLADHGGPGPGNRYLALIAATLFCVHTANTETVNYISSRSSLVATLGVVTSLLVYMGWPRGRRTYLYLVPMLIGGLAKPLVVMFAPILLLFVLFFEKDFSVAALLRPKNWPAAGSVLLSCLPAFVAGGALFIFVDRMNADTLVYAVSSRWDYLLTQPFVWLHYLRLFLLPVGLTADTDWTLLPHWYDTRLFAGLLFIGGLLVVIHRLSGSRSLRPAAFGLAWFGLALLPTSSVFPLSEVYNEHRIFFPYVGLSFALIWLVGVAFRGPIGRGRASRLLKPALTLAALGLVLAHASGTHRRNEVWRTEESLWQDVATKSPRNGRGLMNYGLALMRKGDLRQALLFFDRARTLNPNYSILEVNLGIVKSALGDAEAAEPHFLRALELEPNYARGRYFFARWLQQQGRGPQAITELGRVLEITPGDVDARYLLMRLYAAIDDEAALSDLVRSTLAIVPSDPIANAYAEGSVPDGATEETAEAYSALGRTHLDRERWLDAAVLYVRALRLDPASAVAWNNLGWARLKLGFYAESLPCFEQALRHDPEMDVARNNIAWLERRSAAEDPP